MSTKTKTYFRNKSDFHDYFTREKMIFVSAAANQIWSPKDIVPIVNNKLSSIIKNCKPEKSNQVHKNK